MDYLVVAAFLGVACYYPVCVLLLNFKGGPFTDYRIRIDNIEEFWFLSIFDRFRDLFPNFYLKDDDGKRWVVNVNQSNWVDLFSCPYCLSFWVAFPFSIFLGVYSGEWLWFPFYHLIITSVSIAMNRYV